MPIVNIQLLDGRDSETKRKLLATVTEAVISTLQVPPEKVRVILQEIPPENWAVAGQPLGTVV